MTQSSNHNKRIAIQIMVCRSINRCEKGELTVLSQDEMTDLYNATGDYCENCRYMIWENKNIFPYTAENLGACKA